MVYINIYIPDYIKKVHVGEGNVSGRGESLPEGRKYNIPPGIGPFPYCSVVFVCFCRSMGMAGAAADLNFQKQTVNSWENCESLFSKGLL